MDVPDQLFLDGLQFVQFATAAEQNAAEEEAAGTASGKNEMAEAAEHMKEAFSEMQHLAYLLHVTNKPDAPSSGASFQVCFATFPACCHNHLRPLQTMPMKREAGFAEQDDALLLVHASVMQRTYSSVSNSLRAAAAELSTSAAHAEEWATSALQLSDNATLASIGNMNDLLSLMPLEDTASGAAQASSIAQVLHLPWTVARGRAADGGLCVHLATRKQKADSLQRMAVREANAGMSTTAPDPFAMVPPAAQHYEFLHSTLPPPEKLRLASRALRLPVHGSVLPAQGRGGLPAHLQGPVPGGPGLYVLPSLPPLSAATKRPQWAHGPALTPQVMRHALRAVAPMLAASEMLDTATQVRALVAERQGGAGGVTLLAHVGLEQEWAKAMNAPYACIPHSATLLQPVLTASVAPLALGAPGNANPSSSSTCQVAIPLPGVWSDGRLQRVREDTVRSAGWLLQAAWALHDAPAGRGGADLPPVPPPGLVCAHVKHACPVSGVCLQLRISLEAEAPPASSVTEGGASPAAAAASQFLECSLSGSQTTSVMRDRLDAVLRA